MAEWCLFPEGSVPEYSTAGWYQGRERAPHLEQHSHQGRLHLAARLVQNLTYEGWTVSDLGCGDGGLLSLLPRHIRAWGYDLSPEAVKAAVTDRKVDAHLLDVVHEEPLWGDLSVCTEMLEHLVDPHGFVRRVAWHSTVIVASSPAFETLSSHYEFHLWAWDQDGYRSLLEQAGFAVVHHELVDGFQVIAGRRGAESTGDGERGVRRK